MGWVTALAAALAVWAASAAAECGPSAAPCAIGAGTYHARLPEAEIKGAIVFLHGWGSSGRASLGNRRWVPQALEAGWAVIAPNGTPRDGQGGYRWSFHPDWPQARDDIAFLKAVRDDAAARFDLDPARVALGGFSIGGSMTHYLACSDPAAFGAYIPVGGAFWRPDVQGCNGSVRLLHTHGWRDTTVPLEGRVVRGADADDPEALVQGDVFHAMRLWRRENGCRQLRADRFGTGAPFWRRAWDRCADGTALELALFDGGHTVPAGWIDMTLAWLDAVLPPAK